MVRIARMKKEIQRLTTSPPSNVSCWPVGDKFDELQAQIIGGEGTPYEGGIFNLEVKIPESYPFEPPSVRFLTTIYHPNVDPAGRICLDVLKMPPKGSWKPSQNISTLIMSIQLLMAEPNLDDPLMSDIANIFLYRKSEFEETARQWTLQYARQSKRNSDCDKACAESPKRDESDDKEDRKRKEEKENVPALEAGELGSSCKEDSSRTVSLTEDASVNRQRLMEDHGQKRLSENKDSATKRQSLIEGNHKRAVESDGPWVKRQRLGEDHDDQERLSENKDSATKRQSVTEDNQEKAVESEDPLPKQQGVIEDPFDDDLFPDT